MIKASHTTRAQGTALDSLEGARNYSQWIHDELLKVSSSGLVLEVGAGTGSITEFLGTSHAVVSLEPDALAHHRLQQRFAGRPGIEVRNGTLEALDKDERFDLITYVNVLEHITDDVSELRLASRHLAPGGSIFIWVPAFDLLFSDFDRAIGHQRRYTLDQLKDVASEVGLVVNTARYVNAVGWFTWLLGCRVLGLHPGHRRLVELADRIFVPLSRNAERRFSAPFGQSAIVVMQPGRAE